LLRASARPAKRGGLPAARSSRTLQLASGIDYAQWLICGGFLEQDGKPPAYYDFLVPRRDVSVIDDWHVAGLAGTGSKTFEIKELFVPDHRVQDHIHSDDGTGPGTTLNRAAVFRTPRASVAALGFAALAVGVAEAFLGTYLQHTRQRAGAACRSPSSAARSSASRRAARKSKARHLISRAPYRTGSGCSKAARRSACMKNSRRVFRPPLSAALARGRASAFRRGGRHAIFDNNPLQRQLRDIIAVTTHRGLYFDESAPAYGRSALDTRPALTRQRHTAG